MSMVWLVACSTAAMEGPHVATLHPITVALIAVMSVASLGEGHWRHVAASRRDSRQGSHVIVPDLRGMGLSSHPEGGYERTSQARDIAKILDELKASRVSLVTHDIGNMVGGASIAHIIVG
jgi:pimeloyl-ACP methyl ester carboxylesterase